MFYDNRAESGGAVRGTALKLYDLIPHVLGSFINYSFFVSHRGIFPSLDAKGRKRLNKNGSRPHCIKFIYTSLINFAAVERVSGTKGIKRGRKL